MLHVAKINLCFFSTMCFFLPIESVLCEQKAREWRHKSIQRTCAFYHFECCTQGHTKSDRVETILFNILRGTGIAGLQSLRWKKRFYSFSCQRFYPRLSYYKLNYPQSTVDSSARACSGLLWGPEQARHKTYRSRAVYKPKPWVAYGELERSSCWRVQTSPTASAFGASCSTGRRRGFG